MDQNLVDKRLSFNLPVGKMILAMLAYYFFTIITLGIGGFYALRRLEQYFYRHTSIEGQALQFTNTALNLFKVTILPVIVIIIPYIVIEQAVNLSSFVVFILWLPVLIALIFVAANVTIWQINGTVLPTATEASHYYTNRFKLGLVTLLISLGIVLSLGLAAPYLIKKFSNYVFNRATFSGAKLAFNGNFSNFPKSIFVIFIILLVTAFIPEFLGAGSEDMIAALQSGDYQFLISAYGIHFVINLLSLLISAPLTVAAYKWWCSHTRIESIRPQETLAPTTEPVTV